MLFRENHGTAVAVAFTSIFLAKIEKKSINIKYNNFSDVQTAPRYNQIHGWNTKLRIYILGY